MNITAIDWPSVAAMLTVVTIFSALLLMLLRSKLASDFVVKSEYDALIQRIGVLETGMSQIPRHGDLLALERRLGDLSNSVAAITAFAHALKDDTAAIKHQLNMLIEAKLQEEKA